MRRLSTGLQEQGVEEAVMESTAQYWRSVWLLVTMREAIVLRRPMPRFRQIVEIYDD